MENHRIRFIIVETQDRKLAPAQDPEIMKIHKENGL